MPAQATHSDTKNKETYCLWDAIQVSGSSPMWVKQCYHHVLQPKYPSEPPRPSTVSHTRSGRTSERVLFFSVEIRNKKHYLLFHIILLKWVFGFLSEAASSWHLPGVNTGSCVVFSCTPTWTCSCLGGCSTNTAVLETSEQLDEHTNRDYTCYLCCFFIKLE